MLYVIFLFASLADPIHEVREQATEKLCNLVANQPWLYGPRIIELAKNATEPETVSRCRRITSRYTKWYAYSYVPKTVPVWPCFDFYPISQSKGDIRDKLTLFEWKIPESQFETSCGPHWIKWRQATERFIRYSLASNQMTYEEADILLSRMWALENKSSSDIGSTEWKAEVAKLDKWNGGYFIKKK